jgi:hypothetical protein
MPSLTGRALLPKPTIGPPQIEQTCTGVMARGSVKRGRARRPGPSRLVPNRRQAKGEKSRCTHRCRPWRKAGRASP